MPRRPARRDLAVVGTGYAGLVTAVALAKHRHRVACVDIDPSRVGAVSRGLAPFFEPGLDEALAGLVHARHAGSFVELLKSTRTPLRVRTAAVRALVRVGYPEVVERLVENYFFKRTDDPQGLLRRWVVEQLGRLQDKDKLIKLHEIAHARRKLRYYAMDFEAGDPAHLVQVMAEVDPDHAVRFLGHMVDESTSVISLAAVKALREIRAKHKEPETRQGGHS